MGGLANYSGDLQAKNFTTNQAKGVVTVGATYSLSSKFSLRGEYSFAKVGADDKFSEKQSFRNRNLNFQTLIKDFSLMGEYNIFDLTEKKVSPYVFAGVSAYYASPYTNTAAGEKVYLIGLSTEGQGLPQYPDREVYKKTRIAIPVGGGLKYALSDDIHLGLELGVRTLFTDYLDDVSATYVDQNTLLAAKGATAVDLAFRGDELKTNPLPYPAEGVTRGGKAKDMYYFTQVRIGFRLPWFDGGASGGKRSRYGCPSRVL